MKNYKKSIKKINNVDLKYMSVEDLTCVKEVSGKIVLPQGCYFHSEEYLATLNTLKINGKSEQERIEDVN